MSRIHFSYPWGEGQTSGGGTPGHLSGSPTGFPGGWRLHCLASSFLGGPIRVRPGLTLEKTGARVSCYLPKALRTWYVTWPAVQDWSSGGLRAIEWTLRLRVRLIYVNTAIAFLVTVKRFWKEAVSTESECNCTEVEKLECCKSRAQLSGGIFSHLLAFFVCGISPFVTIG